MYSGNESFITSGKWNFFLCKSANDNIYLITTFTDAKKNALSLIPCFGVACL